MRPKVVAVRGNGAVATAPNGGHCTMGAAVFPATAC